jgi:hypothetical protein
MIDYVSLGTAPVDEDCDCVGKGYDMQKARADGRRYIQQLLRTFGPCPDGCSYRIVVQHHDFGDYIDVVCQFDDAVEGAMDFAYRVEDEAPQKWDDIKCTN